MIKLTTSSFPPVSMVFNTALLLAMVLSLSALFLPGVAFACSCIPIPASKHVAGSKFIFKGTILERRLTVPKNKIFGSGVVYYFQVEKGWKGVDAKRISVAVPTTESSLCGVKLPVGWTGVVFAGENKGKLVTGLCAMLPYHRGQLEDYDKLLPGHR